MRTTVMQDGHFRTTTKTVSTNARRCHTEVCEGRHDCTRKRNTNMLQAKGSKYCARQCNSTHVASRRGKKQFNSLVKRHGSHGARTTKTQPLRRHATSVPNRICYSGAKGSAKNRVNQDRRGKFCPIAKAKLCPFHQFQLRRAKHNDHGRGVYHSTNSCPRAHDSCAPRVGDGELGYHAKVKLLTRREPKYLLRRNEPSSGFIASQGPDLERSDTLRHYDVMRKDQIESVRARIKTLEAELSALRFDETTFEWDRDE